MLVRWLINAVALLAVAYLLPRHISVKGFGGALVAAAVLGIANAIVGPVLRFLAFPITFLTLGLFTWVINGALLYWVGSLLKPNFQARSFGGAILGSFLLAVISSLITWLVKI